MISVRNPHLFIFVLSSVFILNACQEQVEKPQAKLRLRTSHRTAREKTVVVPPEVLMRWKAVKLAVIDKTRGTENIYVIPIGSHFKVPASALTINVDAFLPSFRMEGTVITTSSNELINPGVKVRISEKGVPVFQGWIFSLFPNTHAVTHPKFAFSLIGVVPVEK